MIKKYKAMKTQRYYLGSLMTCEITVKNMRSSDIARQSNTLFWRFGLTYDPLGKNKRI